MSNSIKTNIEQLSENDIYSLILFSLYKIREIPEYSTLSELVYILDRKSLYNFLECFGGMTIKVPTVNELKVIINALLLYQLVDIENKDYQTSLKSISDEMISKKELEICYIKLKSILENYTFARSK